MTHVSIILRSLKRLRLKGGKKKKILLSTECVPGHSTREVLKQRKCFDY